MDDKNSMTEASQSAEDAGYNSAPGAAPVVPCKTSKTKTDPLEYCDIVDMTLVLAAPGKSQTIRLDRKRTTEGIERHKVAKEYWGDLRNHDLVVETLADIKDTTNSEHKVSAKSKPLTLKVSATGSPTHHSRAPKHPICSIRLPEGRSAQAEGGTEVTGEYSAPGGNFFDRTTWGSIWPFSGDKVRRYEVLARSCGNLPIPRKPIGSLAVKLVVLPYEEWLIKIGLDGVLKESVSNEWNRYKEQDSAHSSRRVASTYTVSKKTGLLNTVETSTKTKQMQTQSGLARTRTETSKTTVEPRFLTAKSETTTQTRETWNNKRPSKTKSGNSDRKISIVHKIAGQEVKSEVSTLIRKIAEIDEITKDITKLFDSVKLGWSISANYELLSGNLTFGWGTRWPTTSAYAEQGRVWYVERFMKASGSADLISGSVTGFFGFAVDPWWAPVTVEVGAYLSISAKVSLAPTVEWAWTNTALVENTYTYRTDLNTSLNFECGAKANGKAFGYSVQSKAGVEAAVSFEMNLEMAVRRPPALKGSLMIGLDHKTTTGNNAKTTPDAVRLFAEIIFIGKSVRRSQIDPIVLIEGKECFKDKYFWGEAPEKA